MSTVVCRGLQSCLESQPMETRTLRLKLAPPKPQFSEPIGLPSMFDDDPNKSPIPSNIPHLGGGFNFLQSTFPSNSFQIPKQDFDKETQYVPPMAKRSLSFLSERSLELCTENLGSETGTETIESSFFSLSSNDFGSSSSSSSSVKSPRKEKRTEPKRGKKSNNFPPPLTSSNSIQVRAHREGGRLIIKAMETPKRDTYLHTERSNGRLRLSFLTECNATDFDSEVESEEKGVECEKDGFENEANNGEEEEEEEEYEDEEYEDEEKEEEESEACVSGDMDGNSYDVEVEIGMEKFQRPSRCKEGGQHVNDRLCYWEPFWVATS